VENDPLKIEKLIEENFLFINGDATNDEVLIKAGIEKAKGLVAVVKTDAENVFTTLTARELNKNVFVVARAVEEGTESKLRKAGANRVVKPYELSGNRMVHLLLRPGVIDFIDGVAKDSKVNINLEEIRVGDNSPLINKTLMDSPIRKELNIIIVGINKYDGNFIYNPISSSIIEKGDKLFAIGQADDLNKLTALCLK
jgi:voltage-gated potassium channel